MSRVRSSSSVTNDFRYEMILQGIWICLLLWYVYTGIVVCDNTSTTTTPLGRTWEHNLLLSGIWIGFEYFVRMWLTLVLFSRDILWVWCWLCWFSTDLSEISYVLTIIFSKAEFGFQNSLQMSHDHEKCVER